MSQFSGKTVLITGASSGIGEACARTFAREGARLILTARRSDRLEKLGSELRKNNAVEVFTVQLDVRRRRDVEEFVHTLPAVWKSIDILVNNAGLARGMSRISEGLVEDWEEMIDTNLKGLLYVTRQISPLMVAAGSGMIINIGSIAGHQAYPNGNVYCATKSAVNTLSLAMQMDLLGTGVRVCCISPGLVETEFSAVRFHGDTARASKTYEHMRPLTAGDIADVVLHCATRPPHVTISEVIVMPADQASVYHIHRTPE